MPCPGKVLTGLKVRVGANVLELRVLKARVLTVLEVTVDANGAGAMGARSPACRGCTKTRRHKGMKTELQKRFVS